jgi:hypothetical protein
MQLCGLTQTADTGQVNWTTVTYSSTANTSSGYEIYEFTDALQSTYPIYLKIEYGTGDDPAAANGSPTIWLTVGQGSNGSGTLTGTLTTRTQIGCTNTNQEINTTTISYPTYICFTGSYLGVAHKIGGLLSTSNNVTFGGFCFMVGRACNSSGTYVGGQIMTMMQPANNGTNTYGNANVICTATASSTNYTTTNGYFTFVPFSMTSTAVGGSEFQLFPVWGIFNQVTPIPWALYGLNAEIAQGSTVSATPVGSTANTYIMLGIGTQGWGLPSNANYSMLMLYQ